MSMFEQSELINNQQLQLLRQLTKFDSPIDFHSLTELPSSNTHIQIKQHKQSHQNHLVEQNHLKDSTQVFNQSRIKKRQSSFILSAKQSQNVEQSGKMPDNVFMFLERQLQKSGGQKYNQLKSRLIHYKQKSEQIYKVSEFLKSYEENFRFLVEQKQGLLEMLESIKGETGQLVDKQRKLIDLSMAIKESLDYYTDHSKTQFNYACEISSRQLFQDNLQSTLSTVMDAIDFFTENQTFVASRKHLNLYLSAKSKILSFIKSFFIKLFNKESVFIMKHLSSNEIDMQLNTLYPKSRMKLLSGFLLSFPHMKRCLKWILVSVKEQKVDNEEKEMELRFLQMRQLEIEQLILSESNLSLIRYLEKNNYEIYSEVMLNLFSFNRLNFHENLLFNWTRRINNESSLSKIDQSQKQTEKQAERERLKQYKAKMYFLVQIITAEYIYFQLCCHPSTPPSVQFVTAWMYKLVMKYLQVIVKQTRELVVRWKLNPFQLCQVVTSLVDQELKTYFDHLSKQQYHSYVMGCLWKEIVPVNMERQTVSANKEKSSDNLHSKFLKQLFTNTLKARILNELASHCYQNLPKVQSSTKKQELQSNINSLMNFIPKLQFCSNQSENYLISSLDLIIKSIKLINQSIQSRFECYAWNLILFGVMKNVLKTRKFEVVSKQIRLDFNDSLNIIDKVKRLQRSQSLIQYAQDIFNVIKTGMPSLNQLTLDFNKYINQHYQQLESRFLKDILFIYAKNMIQFLQKIMDSKKRASSDKQIRSEKHFDVQPHLISHNQSQQKNLTSLQNEDQKSPKEKDKGLQNKSQNIQKDELQKDKLDKSPKDKQDKSPKAGRKNSVGADEISRLCEPLSIKSLYNSYILNIEKYIMESCDILKTLQQSQIEHKEAEVNNLKILIREVYEKLFDFLDTFYVTVSEFNSQITAEFEEISKLKQKQQSLWFGTKQPISKDQMNVSS